MLKSYPLSHMVFPNQKLVRFLVFIDVNSLILPNDFSGFILVLFPSENVIFSNMVCCIAFAYRQDSAVFSF